MIAGQPLATVIEYDLLPVHPPKPVAVTVKLNVPLAVGVPLINPEELSDKPPGKAPEVTAKL